MWTPPAYSPIRWSGIHRGLVAGRKVISELEGSLRKWYGAERALATSLGTHALQLALKAASEQSGKPGPVALPSFSCFDLVSAAVWLGKPVIFYDIDPESLSPEREGLTRAAEEAGVLVVSYLFGFPLDWDLIGRLRDARGIPVVEDAAQGMGAEWKGQSAGTFGDLSIFSFGRGKGWTGGSGGAVLARNGFGSGLPATIPDNPGSRFSEAAKAAAVWLMARPSLYGIPARLPGMGLGETHYKPPTEPRGISPFAAAMVLANREASLEEVGVRRRRAKSRRERAEGNLKGAIFPDPLPGGSSGYLRLPFLHRNPAMESPSKGIYGSYPRPLAELEALTAIDSIAEPAHGAIRLAHELKTIPTHSRVGRAL